MAVAFVIVEPVDAELLGVLWLVGPKELDVACSTAVILGLLECRMWSTFRLNLRPLAWSWRL